MLGLFDHLPSTSLDFLYSMVPQLNTIKLDPQHQERLAGKEIGDALTVLRKQFIDNKKTSFTVK